MAFRVLSEKELDILTDEQRKKYEEKLEKYYRRVEFVDNMERAEKVVMEHERVEPDPIRFFGEVEIRNIEMEIESQDVDLQETYSVTGFNSNLIFPEQNDKIVLSPVGDILVPRAIEFDSIEQLESVSFSSVDKSISKIQQVDVQQAEIQLAGLGGITNNSTDVKDVEFPEIREVSMDSIAQLKKPKAKISEIEVGEISIPEIEQPEISKKKFGDVDMDSVSTEEIMISVPEVRNFDEKHFFDLKKEKNEHDMQELAKYFNAPEMKICNTEAISELTRSDNPIFSVEPIGEFDRSICDFEIENQVELIYCSKVSRNVIPLKKDFVIDDAEERCIKGIEFSGIKERKYELSYDLDVEFQNVQSIHSVCKREFEVGAACEYENPAINKIVQPEPSEYLKKIAGI